MKLVREGWDYTLYKIYLVAGLVAIVATLLVATMLFDQYRMPAMTPLWASMAVVTVWVAGILAFWWWQFLYGGYREVKRLESEPAEGTPAVKELKSWGTLAEAMAIHGGSREEQIRLAKASTWPMLVWFGLVPNLSVVLVLAAFWLGQFGLIPYGQDVGLAYMAGGILFVVFAIVVTYVVVGWSGGVGERAYLKALGLSIAETPSMTGDRPEHGIEGATIMVGRRYGRYVQIEDAGRHSFTIVQAETGPFSVRSRDGKLIPDAGAPEPIVRSVKGLRKAKRWKGIELQATQGGVRVERESRGQNMWLYDLWLAERLLEALEVDGASRAK